MCRWMEQYSSTGPGLSNVTDRLSPGLYSPKSNCLAGELEKTLCSIGRSSSLGNSTVWPAQITSSGGEKCASFCETFAVSLGTAIVWLSSGMRKTTISDSGTSPGEVTLPRIVPTGCVAGSAARAMENELMSQTKQNV